MSEPISEEELSREANPGVDQGLAFSPGEAVPNPPGALLTDRVLLQVRLARLKQDDRDGILRDYPDGELRTALDQEALLASKRALDQRKTWRRQLAVAVGEVFASSATGPALQSKLIEVAAVACAWAEGIQIRADDKRIAVEQRALTFQGGKFVRLGEPWWRRFLRAIGFGG